MSQTKAQLISDLVQALNFTGTSSAPANGMYLSAANTINLATNSNGRLTIDSSGNATFTAAVTAAELTISSTSPVISLTDTNNNSDFAIKVESGAFNIRDTTNASNRLTIDSSGNSTFTGNATFNGNNITLSGDYPKIQLNDTDSESDYEIRNNNGELAFRDIDNNSNRLSIAAGGTVSVSSSFVVQGTNITIGEASSSSDHNINFKADTGTFTLKHNRGNHKLELSDSDGTGNILVIDTAGNIGISQTSPTAKLEIDTAHYVVTSSGKSTTGIHLHGNAGNAGEYGGGISFACGGSGAAAIAALQGGADSDIVGLSFFTHPSSTGANDAAEKMRITADGQVNIGGDFSQTSNALNVTGNIFSSTRFNLNGAVLLWQQNRMSLGNSHIIESQQDTPFAICTQGVAQPIVFGTGTAGGVAVEHMRIASGGKIGIGTTAPASVLEVQGAQAYADSASTLATSTSKSAFRVKGSNNSSDSLWMGTETSDANPYIQGANGIGNNAKKLLLNPFGGNVGIGLTAPPDKLNVVGALRVNQSAALDHLCNAGTVLEVRGDAIGSGVTDYDFFKGFKIALNDGAEWGGQAQFAVGRWQENGTNARSSLMISLGHGAQSSVSDADSDIMLLTSDGQVEIIDGNLKIGTSGHGIDFSADGNAGGATSEVLDDYEEGTWTPGIGTTSGATVTGEYRKIGNAVHIQMYVSIPSHSNSSTMSISGLPFSAMASRYASFTIGNFRFFNHDGGYTTLRVNQAGTTMTFRETGDSQSWQNAEWSQVQADFAMYVSGTYFTS